MRLALVLFCAIFNAAAVVWSAESVRTIDPLALPAALPMAAQMAAGQQPGPTADSPASMPAFAAPSAVAAAQAPSAAPEPVSVSGQPAEVPPSREEVRRRWLTHRFQQLDAAFRSQADPVEGEVAPQAVVAGMARTYETMSDYLGDANAAAAFLRHPQAQQAVVEKLRSPLGYYKFMANVYGALQAGFGVDLPAEERSRVTRVWHAMLGSFLSDLEHDPRSPERVRRMAAETREGYLDNDGLLAALSWAGQEKGRVRDARRRFGAELATAAHAADAQEALARQPWQPPARGERRPEAPPKGTVEKESDMPAMTRDFRQAVGRFEAARERWQAARRARLSSRALAAEGRRFQDQARAFVGAIDRHEGTLDYAMDAGLVTTFARNPWRGPAPASKGLRFSRQGDVYRVNAVFQTKIAEPAVLEAFRRSIESYWTGEFKEGGRRKRFVTRVTVRTLAPDQHYSGDALILDDGGTSSSANAQTGVISLQRRFPLSMPAHEFGHLLGLGEGYVNRYDPDKMVFRQIQDRADVMASPEGVVLPRHFAEVVRRNRAPFEGR